MSRSDRKKTRQVGCTAPEIGALVYDYYNGALAAPQVREFERHMIACRHCEAVVMQLDEVMMVLDEDKDLDAHPFGEMRIDAHPSVLHKVCV